MKNPVLLIIAALLVLSFLLYMTTFTVPFTNAAVIATFGSVDREGGVINEGEGGQEGLRFRWPAPIQSVTSYDKRVRFLQTDFETQQTADENQVVVQAFMTWSVSDPLKFYQQFSQSGSSEEAHYVGAEQAIRPLLRSALTRVSRFRFDELFRTEGGASRLADLEQAILEQLRDPAEDGTLGIEDYGITISTLGINRVNYTENVTSAAFDAMRAQRQKLAAEVQAEGEAQASDIRSSGNTDASNIETFAKNEADAIRSDGDTRAAEYLKALNEIPELAVTLTYLELMSEGFAGQVTLILPPTGPLWPFDPGRFEDFTEKMSSQLESASANPEPQADPSTIGAVQEGVR